MFFFFFFFQIEIDFFLNQHRWIIKYWLVACRVADYRNGELTLFGVEAGNSPGDLSSLCRVSSVLVLTVNIP